MCNKTNPCTIRVPEEVPEPTPIILKDNELFRPNNNETKIEDGKSITLFCAGRGNKIVILNQAKVTLTCKDGKFRHEKKEYNLKEMKCNDVPDSELRETRKACANGAGEFYEVGFTYENKFLEILTICFNKATQRTIYSRNIIKRNVEKVRMRRACNTPPFKNIGMNFQPNEFYKVENQTMHFENLFGRNQKFLVSNITRFLARGHLAPNADFTFCYEQFATFYFANCAPEWQQVNAGNWAKVEKATRQLAINTDILTFTGTFDILKLRMPNTPMFTEIYLDHAKQLAAPKWYYKVVHNPNWKIKIVFVTLNNPYNTVGEEVEFCKNICREYGLDSRFYDNVNRGYTFCCELEDFWKNAGISTSETQKFYDLPPWWHYK
ncbi:uncharacterized protein LOC105215114 isoform X2 [Zeugodacus cucurbitae]|uniref:uncharacterized protein LOC105215114 isoform X2 n=1 Tax=Zeugodacus cucurbitae TaxID=28588 RepID=UPI0023D8E631|nr:uncharacterized protein LOC105215114 isoform X2 [Zeugodacus cucurbitae]